MNYTQKEFEDIARMYIKRDGLEELLTMLAKSDFYTAPASTRFHDSEKGGLVKHSIKVYLWLDSEFPNGYTHGITEESAAIVALFHDLCKVGYYTIGSKNVKNEQGKWESVPYYTVDDKFPMGHGEKSVYMVNSCMTLTTEEALAIRWHMGGFEATENYAYISKTYGENPLALLLHLADMKATYLPEEGR